MKIIDTHAHLYAEEFLNDLDEVVMRARQAGVEKVLLPNIDEASVAGLKKLTAYYPGFFIPMMGLHPTSVRKDWEEQLSVIYKELNEHRYIAVGEIGIDLHWDQDLKKQQTEAFEEQLKWSLEKDLPVSIHFRNATNEAIRSVKRVGANLLRGVFHSFGGTREELEAIMDLKNFYVGINGVVTFKNSGLSETLMHCPINRVVLETDAPYLAPVPYRGKRNESAYLADILAKLAEIWKMNKPDIARVTTQNASDLFRISC